MATRRNQTQKAGDPKSVPVSDVVGMNPTIEERIRRRAYLFFERRQHAGVPGDAVSDWLHAGARSGRPIASIREEAPRVMFAHEG